MTLFHLGQRLIFPDPRLAEPEGLLAIGGDLSPERILLAYHQGIFPWYSPKQPILWWSPDPRLVLFPEEVHVSKTLLRKIRKGDFEIKIDQNFRSVLSHCSMVPRPGQDGTWLTPEMKEAYQKLHEMGLAHSIEIHQHGQLMGGLYGLSIGSAFFGESMFSLAPDTSKLALVALCRLAQALGFHYIDCQVPTPHLMSMGALQIPRDHFLDLLEISNQQETKQGNWSKIAQELRLEPGE